MTDEGRTVLLSLEADDQPIQLAQETNVQLLTIEAVHKAVDEEGCDPGPLKGENWFEVTNVPDHPEKFRLRADFVLEGGNVTISGIGKHENGKKKGRFPGRGSGAFAGWRGQVTLDECNPKRWIFDPALPGI